MITTIETRLWLNKEQESLIDGTVLLWSKYYRKTWYLWNNKKLNETSIYEQLMKSDLLTSYQVKSLINKVKTEHAKIKELSKVQLKQNKAKLEKVKKFCVLEEQKIKPKKANKIEEKAIKIESVKIVKERAGSKELIGQFSKPLYVKKSKESFEKRLLVLENKKIKIKRLEKSILVLEERIRSGTFKLCFGSLQLLKQRPGSYSDKFRKSKEQKVYNKADEKENLSDWKSDWDLARNNIWYCVGEKNKPQGNAEIQYYPQTQILRLRLSEEQAHKRLNEISKNVGISYKELNDLKNTKYSSLRMDSRFIEINKVAFNEKALQRLEQVLELKKPITAKIIKRKTPNKEIGFYLQLSFEEVLHLPLQPMAGAGAGKVGNLRLGVDLNVKGIAYCIVKADGNKLSGKDSGGSGRKCSGKCSDLKLKPCGFIKWDLNGKTQNQRKWIISNAISALLTTAQEHCVKQKFLIDIAIENLDFSDSMAQMNSGYKAKTNCKEKTNYKAKTKGIKSVFNYNKMLSDFAKKQFKDLLERKAARLGMNLYLVNPAFSSIGGFVKYGVINKLPVDIAASLWIARQSIFGKEYKKENNLIYIKKHVEKISIAYTKISKQSKKDVCKVNYKDISLALGRNRKEWLGKLLDVNKFTNQLHNDQGFQSRKTIGMCDVKAVVSSRKVQSLS